MRKKLDPKIRALIEACARLRQRGIFVIVGDRGREHVATLHQLLGSAGSNPKAKVLWCYKKELGFSSARKKRMQEIKKLQKQGLYGKAPSDSSSFGGGVTGSDPFELFISTSEIRFCYYKESQNILGNTFGLLVLQDFEALTPNILCQTIETIEGGGIIIFLLKSMSSLKQLYTMSMDSHKRFRTENQDVKPLFNERFLLSLFSTRNVLFLDDELNLLKINSKEPSTGEVDQSAETEANELVKMDKELGALKESLASNPIAFPLVSMAKTLDQANILLTFLEKLQDKTFRNTVAVTAARGRGKSAAIGMAIAGAVAIGLGSIAITAPHPENLKALFDFVLKGLEALGFHEHSEYTIFRASAEEYKGVITRISVAVNGHKHVIQYIDPVDAKKVSSIDVLVVDEAAAIPLPVLQDLFGSHHVLLSSTVDGYEGTGRSLSLKLLKKLREQPKNNGNILRELTMKVPIRYALDDPVERWLTDLLCLGSPESSPLSGGLPHPDQCELYLVSKETLFSYRSTAEAFLQSLMGLFVSSHYKNSPNDLQLLSDAPSHAVFVLISSLSSASGKIKKLPDILCAIQVSLEGDISKQKFVEQSQRGIKPAGDLIPWTISEQFQDSEFASLNGMRVVRIAVHPNSQKMGYGTKALSLLSQFLHGDLASASEKTVQAPFYLQSSQSIENEEEKSESVVLKPKSALQPLLRKLAEVRPPTMDYLGVSYGLTKELYGFWSKNGYLPVYIRQSANQFTGEHTCVMVNSLRHSSSRLREEWASVYAAEFRRRFVSLLSFEFRTLPLQLALSILDPHLTTKPSNESAFQSLPPDFQQDLSVFDMQRLKAYTGNIANYHLVRDLIPLLGRFYFLKKLGPKISLSYSQAAILLGMGPQHKPVDTVASELSLPVSQVLALFNKAIAKITGAIEKSLDKTGEERNKEKASALEPQKRESHKEESVKMLSKRLAKTNDEEILQYLKNKKKADAMEAIPKQAIGNLGSC